jgi:hypothetical protein
LLSLIDRAINAFNAKTDQGSVSDALPFAAVYGLLDALEQGETMGIRVMDQSRFLSLMGGSTKEVKHEVQIADKVMTDKNLVNVTQVTTAGSKGQYRMSGFLTLTDTGRRWAMRLNELSGEPIEPHPGSRDCADCGTLHRNDVACL